MNVGDRVRVKTTGETGRITSVYRMPGVPGVHQKLVWAVVRLDLPKPTRSWEFAGTTVTFDGLESLEEDGENPAYGPGNPDWEHDFERDKHE